MHKIADTKSATDAPQRIAVIPSPFIKLPSPVTINTVIITAIRTPIGTNKFLANGFSASI